MNKVLIANRGEIACRLIKTFKRLGIITVVIFHDEERFSKHIDDSDFAVSLGKGFIDNTYLNIEKIIQIAVSNNCDAIHPGYGFLSENYRFAEECKKANLVFIGPDSEVIRLMGLKSEAKLIAKKAGIPVPDSYPEKIIDKLIAKDFPLLIKAVAGGGGKGLRIVRNVQELPKAIENVKREAKTYFGNEEIIVESYIENARHIEVQILADSKGNIIHLFDRECSIQRNNQKIIEEAPTTNISNSLRNELYNSAIRFSKYLNYTNAGTVEFLVCDNKYYFLEMNTRIQVEHTVTETITGVDVVEQQINIAKGESLPDYLSKIKPLGVAIEARIYAEKPEMNFIPSSGDISLVSFPKNVRTDTFIQKKTRVTPNFDALLSKIIVMDENRENAINKMIVALDNTVIHGIDTNVFYLRSILKNENFRQHNFSTSFINEHHLRLINIENVFFNDNEIELLIATFLYKNLINPTETKLNLWNKIGPVELNCEYTVRYNNVTHKVRFLSVSKNQFKIKTDRLISVGIISDFENRLKLNVNGSLGECFYSSTLEKTINYITLKGRTIHLYGNGLPEIPQVEKNNSGEGELSGRNTIVSPLYGKILKINVKVSDLVKRGEVLLTIESMKTENQIMSKSEGVVETVLVEEGSQVTENLELLIMNSINNN